MIRHRCAASRPRRPDQVAPHTQRQRYAAVERVNAELLALARRVKRLGWSEDEEDACAS